MATESKAEEPKAKRPLPPWRMPEPMDRPLAFWDQFYPLRVTNSLTRTKVPFVPMKGKRVLWYQCGPTVYDSAHMGHARTYLGLDILRRIMTKMFGYDLVVAMNITNIDDKIILRSQKSGIPFDELAAKYEAEFMSDMQRLGVLPPHALTRVTEYVPQVIDFVQTIVDKGFGYASNGSVYFDVDAYSKSSDHTYGKLVPDNVNNVKEVEDGDGSLTSADDKRNRSDFALWKASKAGEPSWESPWGPGRPGWHIECSAMATDALKDFEGGTIDIHAGGWDLRFPHHENEIAQSEACLGCDQWVNYWLHTGHLDIDGLKMSKSLKNFITIGEILETFTARQIRLLFLGTHYNKNMTYSEGTMAEAAAIDKKFSNFFENVKVALRKSTADKPQEWTDVERELASFLMDTKRRVREALCDDFDTPTAMQELVALRDKWTAWLTSTEFPARYLLSAGAEYVTEVFDVFGLVNPNPAIGYAIGGAEDRETVLAPVLDAVAAFRAEVRAAARDGDVKAVLRACDTLRDEKLPVAGVRLEDESGSGSLWKLVDPEEVRRELAAKAEAAEAKARQKAERAAAEAEKAAKNRVPPSELFKGDSKYSKFDDKGIPTHGADGEPLPKSKLKSLAKEYNKQKVAHTKQLAKDAKAAEAAAGAAGAGAGAGVGADA